MSRVYITDYVTDPWIERDILGSDVACALTPDVEVLLVWHQRIDAAYLDKVPRLRAIVRYGVGFDNIDLEEARRRGIAVANTPDYGVDEVSDTTLAMILNIVRGVSRYYSLCSRGQLTWQENTLPILRRTSDVVLGVVGAGRIGGSVLFKASSVGFQTVLFDPYKPPGHEKMLGARRVDDLQSLLEQSDIVSVHAPLTEETYGMIDEVFVRHMKKDASLVNTARGGILKDLDVLYEPMKSERVWAVALDVLPEEPPVDGKLFEAWRRHEEWLAGRLLINPHTAYFSQTAYREMREKAATNALRALEGRGLKNRVDVISPGSCAGRQDGA